LSDTLIVGEKNKKYFSDPPNHPWVRGIQVCSNEGGSPSPRGENSHIAESERGNKEYFNLGLVRMKMQQQRLTQG
jgi:hypothetical protein